MIITEIRSNWNNKLYPTNSVYQASPDSSSKQSIASDPNANAASYDETMKEAASEEVEYDDEYADGQQSSREIHESRNERNATEEMRKKYDNC